jgi:hypothetical protein
MEPVIYGQPTQELNSKFISSLIPLNNLYIHIFPLLQNSGTHVPEATATAPETASGIQTPTPSVNDTTEQDTTTPSSILSQSATGI